MRRPGPGSAARAADQPDRSRVVLARLLKLAIPITLSSCSMSLVTIIDTNLVNNQLQNVFTAIQGGMTGISNSFLDIFPKAVEIFQNNTDAWQQALLTRPPSWTRSWTLPAASTAPTVRP